MTKRSDPLQSRLTACRIVQDTLQHRGSLSTGFTSERFVRLEKIDQAFVKNLCFLTMRHIYSLHFFLDQLLKKPLKNRDADIQSALLIGLCQLFYLDNVPPHATVSTTVELTRKLRKNWASGMANAVLREAERRHADLLAASRNAPEAATEMPHWLLDQIDTAWSDSRIQVISESAGRAPLCLRVNRQHTSRESYMDLLDSHSIDATPHPLVESAITLCTPMPATEIPGFLDGLVSIQDCAAQLSAGLLAPKPGMRVLDACAAPGGKTGHLLELQPDLDLTALDCEATRLPLIKENLDRLNLNATVHCANATAPQSWWDGRPYDRILVDSPCSGTGVIRRHPDIKWARNPADIDKLVQQQEQILSALWPLLAQEGILLYATCSILPQENSQLIEQWLDRNADAQLFEIDAAWGRPQPAGRQILPGDEAMDGFYYARLCKRDC